MRQKVLLAIFVLIFFIAGFNQLAIGFHLFFQVWWADVLLHFLGGTWIALASFWAYYLSGYIRNPKTNGRTVLFVTIGVTLIVGIGWELFEYSFHFPRESNYRLDTFEDLVMDTLGAFFIHAYAITRNWVSRRLS